MAFASAELLVYQKAIAFAGAVTRSRSAPMKGMIERPGNRKENPGTVRPEIAFLP
jgi:hypothetical protein